ncbi:MAG: hypothetical protein ACLS6G_05340 [Christensenellales bacterium]
MLSTRGAPLVSESMAILRGLAPDGGLYVPRIFRIFRWKKSPRSARLIIRRGRWRFCKNFCPISRRTS